MTKENIYKKALEKWGVDLQMNMAIEEMCELIHCIALMRRGRPHNIHEEIADVKIMIEQLSSIVGDKLVDKEYRLKLKRLDERLRINNGRCFNTINKKGTVTHFRG